MLIAIPDALSVEQLGRIRSIIEAADWVAGHVSAGQQAALTKRNHQLPDGSPAAREAGAIMLDALGGSAQFVSAALPARVLPPLFNRYQQGEAYGTHIDNAIRAAAGARLRADLSATVFLEEPERYDGGELVIESMFGEQRIKLAAGHMILYPSSSLHRVEPVTRGVRHAGVLWVESMVRNGEARHILYELDQSIQILGGRLGPGDPEMVRLTGVYHNLLRQWANP